MRNDVTAKLAKCETSLKRWHTRLVRASTMVAKLEKQRRRLQTQMGPVNLTDLIGPDKAKPVEHVETSMASSIDVAEVQRQLDDMIGTSITPQKIADVAAVAHDKLDIPPFLKRTQADVDKLKAERKSKEAAAKKAMPLTGRAALAALKAPPQKKRRTA